MKKKKITKKAKKPITVTYREENIYIEIEEITPKWWQFWK